VPVYEARKEGSAELPSLPSLPSLEQRLASARRSFLAGAQNISYKLGAESNVTFFFLLYLYTARAFSCHGVAMGIGYNKYLQTCQCTFILWKEAYVVVGCHGA
jgi:hypothetical protein